VHLGLRYFADPNSEIVSRLVEREKLVVVCSAQQVGPETAVTLEQIGTWPWVTFPIGEGSSGETFATVLEQTLAAAGLSSTETIAIDSLTAQKRLIEAGFGLGLLPMSSIREELHLGTLRQLDVSGLQDAVPVMVIYRNQATLSRAVQSLLNELEPGPDPFGQSTNLTNSTG